MKAYSNRAFRALLCLASVVVTQPSFAHATLERSEASAGASYKAVMRVPHGCAGAATIRVRVKIPDGVIGVKPMPKAGWTLQTVRNPYDRVYELQHAKVSEGVTEISWTGGPLPDDQYDEFVFVGTLADDLKPGSKIYFPTVQDCETGANRWIEIPTAGKSSHELNEPAPGLTVTPGKAN